MSFNVSDKIHALKKRVYHLLSPFGSRERKVAFIFGCQRSGTTMLSRTLRRDMRSVTYGERGIAKGSGRGSPTQLLPYDEIERIFDRARAQLLVAKPLVESQHATRLLDRFENSKGIWLYRHYYDVASSLEKKFGRKAALYNLNALFSPELADHWFGINVPDEIRETARPLVADLGRPSADLHALCWWVRNSLYFAHELDQDQRILLSSYEDLTAQPSDGMRRIYRHLGVSYPGDFLVSDVHNRSVGKGGKPELAPEIEELCSKLLEQLRAAQELMSCEATTVQAAP